MGTSEHDTTRIYLRLSTCVMFPASKGSGLSASEPQAPYYIITSDEAQQVIGAAKNDRDLLFLGLLWETGLRVSPSTSRAQFVVPYIRTRLPVGS